MIGVKSKKRTYLFNGARNEYSGNHTGRQLSIQEGGKDTDKGMARKIDYRAI